VEHQPGITPLLVSLRSISLVLFVLGTLSP